MSVEKAKCVSMPREAWSCARCEYVCPCPQCISDSGVMERNWFVLRKRLVSVGVIPGPCENTIAMSGLSRTPKELRRDGELLTVFVVGLISRLYSYLGRL